ncbi:hypothetical protein DZF91_13335 [Actinomadura logoneensis]|uniref:Serine/threonine protein kinase n=1 Tax=Actinomadura logoneensis TaxID=2293572 RepID=A0A372JMC4_9ACTN|nr:hypothetical protein [Actinomadura logoneensis]RFU41157.1 hypothetical protein DZF91_13335 [Actinomadura logoneensis]
MLRPIAATALILALATACGGGGDSGTDAGSVPPPTASGSPNASGAPGTQRAQGAQGGGGPGSTGSPNASGSPGASGGPSTPGTVNGVAPGRAAPSKLDGTWTAGGVKLFFYRGAAALNTPNFCTGTVDPQNTITLTCADGSTKRTQGKAVLDGKTLTVTWTGGTVDKLTRKS